jgi:hypothetical protein
MNRFNVLLCRRHACSCAAVDMSAIAHQAAQAMTK